MLASCGHGGQGELVGAYNRKFKNDRIPLGMVYIPPGHTPLGGSDEDITFSQNGPSRMVTISAFFMDQTEISNAEYRQFTNWVRDSIAIAMMGNPQQFMMTPRGNAAAPLVAIDLSTGGRLDQMVPISGKTGEEVEQEHRRVSWMACTIRAWMHFREEKNLMCVSLSTPTQS